MKCFRSLHFLKLLLSLGREKMFNALWVSSVLWVLQSAFLHKWLQAHVVMNLEERCNTREEENYIFAFSQFVKNAYLSVGWRVSRSVIKNFECLQGRIMILQQQYLFGFVNLNKFCYCRNRRLAPWRKHSIRKFNHIYYIYWHTFYVCMYGYTLHL